jgi:hypothetical protein
VLPALTSPNDVGVFATVWYVPADGGEKLRTVEPAQVGEIGRAAAADAISVQSYVELLLLAYTDEVIHAYTVEPNGTIIGAWSWHGSEPHTKDDPLGVNDRSRDVRPAIFVP